MDPTQATVGVAGGSGLARSLAGMKLGGSQVELQPWRLVWLVTLQVSPALPAPHVRLDDLVLI